MSVESGVLAIEDRLESQIYASTGTYGVAFVGLGNSEGATVWYQSMMLITVDSELCIRYGYTYNIWVRLPSSMSYMCFKGSYGSGRTSGNSY